LRREEVEKAANKFAGAAATPGSEQYRNIADDFKLNQMMSADSKLATLYKDTLTQIKLDKEFDYNNLERIHK